jgi:hypothetical protein
MNGPSGFREVLSSTSRTPTNRLLHEQQPQFGTSSWHFLHTHDLIARSTGISRNSNTVPDTVSRHRFIKGYQLHACSSAWVLCGWFPALDPQRSRP